MKAENLKITAQPVEIKVVRVGGHKMTIAVFNQIELLDDSVGLDDIKDFIFGYVRIQKRNSYICALLGYEGRLYKLIKCISDHSEWEDAQFIRNNFDQIYISI